MNISFITQISIINYFTQFIYLFGEVEFRASH
jgi:hypothetical protein